MAFLIRNPYRCNDILDILHVFPHLFRAIMDVTQPSFAFINRCSKYYKRLGGTLNQKCSLVVCNI